LKVVTSQDAGPLSNSYVIGDRPGGACLLIDAGTPTNTIHEAIVNFDWKPQALFITHRHPDHIAHRDEYVQRYSIPVFGHCAEAIACGGFDREVKDGESFSWEELRVRILHLPGHTAGHVAVLVSHESETVVFTGDTLFFHSVGGSRGSGNTGFEDLQHSIRNVLLGLPDETLIYPGHSKPTSIGEEREHNPYVQAWASSESEGEPCEVRGQPAQLLLRGPDYDGGTKCWVRWPDGAQDIVPGSMVQTGV
jgi:hydroxyacylglutathione hydrolase